MRAKPIDEFIQDNFKDAGDLAERLDVDRNTIYRMKAKGVVVIGTRDSFTLYYPKQSYPRK